MKIDYLFSKNEKLGSKAISWGSALFIEHVTLLDKHKIPSHVAVLLDDVFVIEAVFSSGVRIIPLSEWLKHNEICYRITCKENDSLDTVRELLFEMYGKKYDWAGILYFGWSMTKFYLFNHPLPEFNKWEREEYFFCTEFASRIADYNYSMTTPAKMCNDLLIKSAA